MKLDDSAIAPSPRLLPPLPTARAGIGWGLVGVSAFSFTVPFTRIAVGGADGPGIDPFLIGCGRAVVAAALAAVALAIGRAVLPTIGQWVRLLPVALGVVAGFPILTSLALTDTDASHAAVVIGLLPAATAVAAVVLAHERPSRRFWFGATLGCALTVGFVLVAGGSGFSLGKADLYLLGAVVLAAIGYAQGGVMARELGAWQTVSWALILSAPVMTVLSAVRLADHPPTATTGQWAAFGYLCAVSMFLGFFAWYRGLAIGPMSTVGQTQLLQPVLTVAWSVLLLGESLTPTVCVGALAVIGATAFTVRSRVGSRVGGRPS